MARAKKLHSPKGASAASAIPDLVRLLRKQWPATRCELNFSNALELMVAVIMAAQSTDKGVNEITPNLFKKYRTPEDYLRVPPEVFEREIVRTGFFRAKTRSIRGACQTLIDKFGGQVPKTMDELLELPGIGRKSANVILGAAYGIPVGVVVDTHMIRLSHRLNLSRQEDPVKIEQDLNRLVPLKDRIFFSQAMVLHGRYICVARQPRCWECELIKVCPYPDKIPVSPDNEKGEPRKTITGIPIRVRA
ncbi:MAG TPA: endonuclease III [Elusimicrobiota bacterium]|nr:endonuclease III [Elusimicrobiota bacterium]